VAILQGFVPSIFQFLETVASDANHNEGLLRACMGVIGYVLVICLRLSANNTFSDIGEAFPDGQFSELFRSEYLTRLIRETRTARDFSSRTVEAARWARQMVKAQSNKHQGNIMNHS
jgi:importin subunit beta-1